MYFPISSVAVSSIFLAGPMMFLAGLPMNFVVGPNLAHMTGKSIVASRRHRLLGIGSFTAFESVRALQLVRTEQMEAKDALAFRGITRGVHRFRLPPMVSLPNSGIESIAVWVALGESFLIGLLAGVSGVGGGFIRMPMMIYLIGIPTHVAVGTGLFEIVMCVAIDVHRAGTDGGNAG